jgi:hypothetical protein
MRLPRFRFTIRWLMILPLVAGLLLGGGIYYRSWKEHQVTVRQAEASYRQAMLVREVAEYALKEYEQGIVSVDPERSLDPRIFSLSTKGRVDDIEAELAETRRSVLEQYTRDKQIQSLVSDIEKARADEQTRLATLRLEQSRLWRIFGF